MSTNENTSLPELTPEQEQLLRDKFKREDLAKQPVNDHVYTNPNNSRLGIPDLGAKLPDGGFSPEYFSPFETKNLLGRYKRKEIENSKFLHDAVEQGLLVKGAVPRDQLEKTLDPLAVRARRDSEGEFEDPIAVGDERNGRHFDQKLRELQKKEEREDKLTQKR